VRVTHCSQLLSQNPFAGSSHAVHARWFGLKHEMLRADMSLDGHDPMHPTHARTCDRLPSLHGSEHVTTSDHADHDRATPALHGKNCTPAPSHNP
jgi:hypothetical protein